MTAIAFATFVIGLVTCSVGFGFMRASLRDSEESLRILNQAKIHHEATAALLAELRALR